MRSIVDLSINLQVDYVRRHKQQLQHFFKHFHETVLNKAEKPLLVYKISEKNFDTEGTLWVEKSSLDTRSMRLIQKIEHSYMSTSFFTNKHKTLGSRGYVYYSSAAQDADVLKTTIRVINNLSITVDILSEQYPLHSERWEFGVYALLDDLRYKLLILDDAFETVVGEHTALLNSVVVMFYDYLQGLMPTVKELEGVLSSVRQVIRTLIDQAEPARIRTYKEADHPLQNLCFRDTLLAQLRGSPVDVMVGMRFGGAELPHLLSKYMPEVRICKIRVSNYTQADGKDFSLPSLLRSEDAVLLLDDNILTGRTLQLIVQAMKRANFKEVYFGCVTYSGMKRYPQMIMENHGMVNMDVLRWSCVVGESQYTRINNSQSYKNSNGVFDKIKSSLQKRVNDERMRYRL